MTDHLKILASTTKTLESLNHPDSYRVAKEIVEHFGTDTNQIDSALKRIKQEEPWDYIRGYTIFRDLRIKVNKNVLIPRIETEQIVDIVKNLLPRSSIKTIIDVGTGSGAIIKAIEKETGSRFQYIAVEKSKKALEVARKNLIKTSVQLIHSDLLTNTKINEKSLIIANLPYIPTKQYLQLDRSVKEYEPRDALDGGENGTDTIDRLLGQCSEQKLVIKIILEIDPQIVTHVVRSIESHLPGHRYKLLKDYRGVTRFVLIER